MVKNRIIIYGIAVIICLFMGVPFLWGILLSFKDNFEIFNHPFSLPKTFNFHAYIDTFKQGHMGTMFKNSLIVCTITVTAHMIFLFFSSYAIARLNHRTKWLSSFFYYLFLVAMSVPVFVLMGSIYAITLFMGDHVNSHIGIDTLYGLILPLIARQIPFSTLMLVGGMRGLPLEMEEAAIIDGCGLFGLLFRISFVLLMPVITVLFILTILEIWNEFPITSILLQSTQNYTIPLALSFFKQEYSMDYGAMMRAIIMILIPQLIFYMIFQKKIVQGIALEGIKG
jgi:raffinose/stachyose/melibiose transport system permease protein